MDNLKVLEQTHAYKILSNVIVNEMAPQNILLTGTNNMLKAELTQFYLQSRFCENYAGKPCLECQSCRFIEHKQHPDVYWYEIGAKFGKDEMQQLQTKLSESALLGKSRAYIIEQLDLLTPQAQNAWLKFLEEPFNDVYCIAWIDNENQILPTVKSRFLSLFVNNQQLEETPTVHESLVTKFIERYTERSESADLLLLIEKNMKTTDEFTLFLHSFMQMIVSRGVCSEVLPLVSKAQKMIATNVPQDQVAVYFCLNIYSMEVFE